MKTERQILEKAIELIENPQDWIQNHYYANKNGETVAPELAERRCAVGALWTAGAQGQQINTLAAAIVGDLGASLSVFNDFHLHSEVILAMKRALDRV